MKHFDILSAGILISALGINAQRIDREDAREHEGRNRNSPAQLYWSAPSRYHLDKIIKRAPTTTNRAQELRETNAALNECLERYETRADFFMNICHRDPHCRASYRTETPTGPRLSETLGLDGLSPNSFTAGYVPIRLSDITTHDNDACELNAERAARIHSMVSARIETALARHHEALTLCRTRRALVDQALARQPTSRAIAHN